MLDQESSRIGRRRSVPTRPSRNQNGRYFDPWHGHTLIHYLTMNQTQSLLNNINKLYHNESLAMGGGAWAASSVEREVEGINNNERRGRGQSGLCCRFEGHRYWLGCWRVGGERDDFQI